MKYNYIAESNTGLKRTINEDSLGIYHIDDGLLIIVCDGLGGNKAGDIASGIAVRTIFNYFKNSSMADYLERIKGALELANSELRTHSYNNPDQSGMATTAEVLFLKEGSAFWGHIGDSRIYLYNSEKIYQLTKDHSLVQQLIDNGQLTLKEAENHPDKNVIIKALGKSPSVIMDLSKTRIPGRDWKFLVCTDGLSSIISDMELADIIAKSAIETSAEILIKRIEQKGAPDNYSFVIIIPAQE